MFRYIAILILITLPLTILAQTPIPRQGNSCPTGTYLSGDYCKPFKSSADQDEQVIEIGRDKTAHGERANS
jgi:hypothetical protein